MKETKMSEGEGCEMCDTSSDGDCCGGGSSGKGCCSGWSEKKWRGGFLKKLCVALVIIFIAYAIVWMGTLIRNNVRGFYSIGLAPAERHNVTISGEGKVTATPNIAYTDIGMVTEGKDVADSQKENSEKMNSLIGGIKAAGVADADIQTSQYNIYPRYSYEAGKSRIDGYTVSQSVRVKIRDLTKINDILGLAGKYGANQVSGVQFTIDDPEMLQAEARAKAVEQAKKKAAMLAGQLGVKFTRIVSFSESFGGGGPMPMYLKAEGVGGAEFLPPQVEPGSLEVQVQVSITFELQ
ncbi:MAG: hypothetical protein HW383_139 [Candidatus Magasanikbacteria bacterium]|nr:hypothetical protein [Candidatus Magasanikbacteria bacterium]